MSRTGGSATKKRDNEKVENNDKNTVSRVCYVLATMCAGHHGTGDSLRPHEHA